MALRLIAAPRTGVDCRPAEHGAHHAAEHPVDGVVHLSHQRTSRTHLLHFGLGWTARTVSLLVLIRRLELVAPCLVAVAADVGARVGGGGGGVAGDMVATVLHGSLHPATGLLAGALATRLTARAAGRWRWWIIPTAIVVLLGRLALLLLVVLGHGLLGAIPANGAIGIHLIDAGVGVGRRARLVFAAALAAGQLGLLLGAALPHPVEDVQ